MVDLRLYVEITGVDGGVVELRDDDPNPEDRPRGLRFTTARGDGFKDCSFRLARRADREYPDIRLWDDVLVLSHQDELAWEGYVAAQPRVVEETHELEVQCVGWMTHAKDHKVPFLGVDRDLGRFTGPSLSWQTANITGGYAQAAGQAAPDATNGRPSLVLGFDDPGASKAAATAQYDPGPGCKIGKVYYDTTPTPATIAHDGFSWAQRLYTSDADDQSGLATSTFAGASGYLDVPSKRYLIPEFRWDFTTSPGTGTWQYAFLLAMYGDHGLPLIGPDDPKGLAASDLLRHLFSRHAPLLRLDGIQDTTYPIRQFAFPQATFPYDMVLKANAFHRWGLEVWENRTVYFAPPDLSRYDWQFDTGDSEHPVGVQLQGDTIDGLFNGIAVSFADFFGHGFRLTPDDTPELLWPDPEHEATRHGRQVWDELELSNKTLAPDAAQMGRVRLAEANQSRAPGVFVLKRGVIRDAAGVSRAAWKVRAGQTGAYVSHPSDQPRLVTETTWDHDAKTATVSVDNALATFEGVVERWTSESEAAGIT